ncbi:MAG: hypothetical protein WD042_04195 [Phycisphaeraceae bacterium]
MSSMPTQTRGKLIGIRIIWLAMLMGEVGFMAVIAVLIGNQSVQAEAELARLMLLISTGMLLTLVPLGYFIRSQIYKRHWVGDAVTAQGYVTGNIVLLALCEASAFAGLLGCMFGGSFWPGAVPVVLAMIVQVINYPTGSAMYNSALS